MAESCIAVLDIGKTNKKILAFDENLNILTSAVEKIDEVERNGLLSDNVEDIRRFFFGKLAEINREYPVKAISISAHGATFACVDEDGELTVPQVSYTNDPGEEFHEQFYQDFGDPAELQKETATPNFNLLLNAAKGIYFVKQKFPDDFARTKYILNYNTYFGYLLTGVASSEHTYVGCHTYLWDFHNNCPSSVACKMGVDKLLPTPVMRPWDVVGKISPAVAEETGLSPETIVAHGLHDSNAALVPYMCTVKDDFVLNSTGTWCVDMHEMEKVEFAEEELGKTVFYNLNAWGRPVKTSIFLGGAEFETYLQILQQIHGKFASPEFDPALCQKLINEKNCFIMPGVTPGTGQFPESRARVIEGDKEYLLEDIKNGKVVPEFMKDLLRAISVLDLSLVVQNTVALDRVDMKDGLPMFTEGGFRKDDTYNKLLAGYYPDSRYCLTNLEEASAAGAAICGKCALEGVDLTDAGNWVTIETEQVEPPAITSFEQYKDAFLEQL